MTLAQMRQAYPHLFYMQQLWYVTERFMQTEAVALPSLTAWSEDIEPRLHVTASDLAAAYVQDPTNAIWRRFLWTDDYTQHGKRVYVGGIGEDGIPTFQIHRDLKPSCYYVRAA